jgi:hypothetical protein
MPHASLRVSACTLSIDESNRELIIKQSRKIVAETDAKTCGRGVFDLDFDDTSSLVHHEQLARSPGLRLWHPPRTIATLRSVQRRRNAHAETLGVLLVDSPSGEEVLNPIKGEV